MGPSHHIKFIFPRNYYGIFLPYSVTIPMSISLELPSIFNSNYYGLSWEFTTIFISYSHEIIMGIAHHIQLPFPFEYHWTFPQDLIIIPMIISWDLPTIFNSCSYDSSMGPSHCIQLQYPCEYHGTFSPYLLQTPFEIIMIFMIICIVNIAGTFQNILVGMFDDYRRNILKYLEKTVQ